MLAVSDDSRIDDFPSISDKEINYLMARGLTEEQAKQMIVSGFINPVIKQLPLEYAVELNKLMAMEMEGSVG